jgi:hypothetical protein
VADSAMAATRREILATGATRLASVRSCGLRSEDRVAA